MQPKVLHTKVADVPESTDKIYGSKTQRLVKSHEDRDNVALDKGKGPISTHKDTGDNEIQEHS